MTDAEKGVPAVPVASWNTNQPVTDAGQAAEILRQFADAHDEHHAVRHYEHGVLVGWAPLINVAEFVTGGLRKTLTTKHLRTVVEDRDRLAARVIELEGERNYDRDPAAVAWARAKVQAEADRLTRWRNSAKAEGKTEQAMLWRRMAAHLHRHFIGGDNCVIAAFDERLPEWAATVATDPTSTKNGD